MSAPPNARALLLALGCCAGLVACGRTPDTPPLPTAAPPSTPTAPALLDVREGAHLAPGVPAEPGPGAPCGVVDRLDTPLGPPDGAGFRVRWPFARVSGRYGGQLHAGEDWVAEQGPSLGMPVHAVGHGQVTYAQPYGWGATDKGVVIVRHVWSDGATKLSLYGHLEPGSVTLHEGACVARGDEVGRVGKPRGAPHLHFEIRDRLANSPGPGYWTSDPTNAGWEPPSGTIWGSRLAQHPAVRWTTPATVTRRAPVGVLPSGVVVLEGALGLVGIDRSGTGDIRWRADGRGASVVDATQELLYQRGAAGEVEAYAVGPTGPEAQPAWVRPPPGGTLRLAAWPAGGVVALAGGEGIAFGPAGEVLWRHDLPRTEHVVPVAGGLAFVGDTRDPETWFVDARGTLRGPVPVGGTPAATPAGKLALLRPEGVYEVDPATLAARRLVGWRDGALRGGGLAALADGELLVLRRSGDWRLERVTAAGTPRWTKRLARADSAPTNLLQTPLGPLLALTNGDLLSVDPATGAATRIFRLGADPEARAAAAADPAGDVAYVTTEEGMMVAVDVARGLEASRRDLAPDPSGM